MTGRGNQDLAFLERNYAAMTLVKALLRKARRRLLGWKAGIEPRFHAGFTVFDCAELDGGGSGFGRDYIRVLHDLGLRECGRLFEFCAGPGYIGYTLLAHGFCRSLVLADVNPLAAEAARKTAQFNRLDHRVTVYQCDGIEQLPETEKWDLVVGNPPHFCRWPGQAQLRAEDADWRLHRRFYAHVPRFLNPGASVLLQENALGSEPGVFDPMIRASGGKLIQSIEGPDLGRGGRIYYLLARWD